MTRMLGLATLLCAAACQQPIMAGGDGQMGAADDDPLSLVTPALDGTLDHLHREIVARSCASTQGACHAGQFEPNLSTPALFYANLVNRPGLEHERQLRVEPGKPDASLIIDKLRGRGVGTQMPLGAPPLSEERIALFEQWIRDGALRRPGAEPAPKLNNPPLPPEIAVFDTVGQRLDGGGPVEVAVGQPLVLRHSVKDFESEDPAIPYAGFFLSAGDGRQVVLKPGSLYPDFGEAMFEAGAPKGKADDLNYKFVWTVPPKVQLRDDAGVVTEVPSAGLSLTVVAYYVDSDEPDGIPTFTFGNDLLKVK
jgi:hypothetical protein